MDPNLSKCDRKLILTWPWGLKCRIKKYPTELYLNSLQLQLTRKRYSVRSWAHFHHLFFFRLD
jgi:hypothetical protein